MTTTQQPPETRTVLPPIVPMLPSHLADPLDARALTESLRAARTAGGSGVLRDAIQRALPDLEARLIACGVPVDRSVLTGLSTHGPMPDQIARLLDASREAPEVSSRPEVTVSSYLTKALEITDDLAWRIHREETRAAILASHNAFFHAVRETPLEPVHIPLTDALAYEFSGFKLSLVALFSLAARAWQVAPRWTLPDQATGYGPRALYFEELVALPSSESRLPESAGAAEHANVRALRETVNQARVGEGPLTIDLSRVELLLRGLIALHALRPGDYVLTLHPD